MTDNSPTPQVKQRRDFFPFGEEIPADSSHGNRHLVLDNGVATYNFSRGVTQQFTDQHRTKSTTSSRMSGATHWPLRSPQGFF